jgi:hypothetical protein
MPTRQITPSECKDEKDVLALDRTVFEWGRYWMMVSHDGSVTFCEQERGKPNVGIVSVPRHVLQKFITWYESPQ